MVKNPIGFWALPRLLNVQRLASRDVRRTVPKLVGRSSASVMPIIAACIGLVNEAWGGQTPDILLHPSIQECQASGIPRVSTHGPPAPPPPPPPHARVATGRGIRKPHWHVDDENESVETTKRARTADQCFTKGSVYQLKQIVQQTTKTKLKSPEECADATSYVNFYE